MSKGHGRIKHRSRQQRRAMDRAKPNAAGRGENVLTLLALHMDRLGLMQVEFTRHELEAGGVPGKSIVVEGDEEILRIRLLPTSVLDEMNQGKLPRQHQEDDGTSEEQPAAAGSTAPPTGGGDGDRAPDG